MDEHDKDLAAKQIERVETLKPLERQIWRLVEEALVEDALVYRRPAHDKLFKLDNEPVQIAVLDFIQQVTDSPTTLPTCSVIDLSSNTEVIIRLVHRRLRELLLQLSLAYHKLPHKLFLDRDPNQFQCEVDSWSAGGFADIHRGIYRGELVAVKRLRIFKDMPETKKKEVTDAFHHECLLWRTLSHEHVLSILGVDDQMFRGEMCMVMPWMTHGNIRNVLTRLISLDLGSASGSHSEDGAGDSASLVSSGLLKASRLDQVHCWIKEITAGLAYLHEEGIVHGDLRGHNILLNASLRPLISDFGLAVFADGASKTFGSVRGGNIRWLAPEVMDPTQYKSESVRPTYAADIYSFACLCVELYTANAPFMEHTSDFAVLGLVLDGSRPRKPQFVFPVPDGDNESHNEPESQVFKEIGDGLWSILERCWSHVPSERPSVGEVLGLLYQTDLRLGATVDVYRAQAVPETEPKFPGHWQDGDDGTGYNTKDVFANHKTLSVAAGLFVVVFAYWLSC
ncbi:hypothetical protein EUX98_g1594 [Antrodiella citrinella]|uniref:Protein kinase domain-containing protein n=1 Tax=Antrodiella citrinella TaxID=2447956 RepID=A0A4S4N3F2_9APHY|nr:hypothetical protein EUX98_g1594 [Antrodiella citrinella]